MRKDAECKNQGLVAPDDQKSNAVRSKSRNEGSCHRRLRAAAVARLALTLAAANKHVSSLDHQVGLSDAANHSLMIVLTNASLLGVVTAYERFRDSPSLRRKLNKGQG